MTGPALDQAAVLRRVEAIADDLPKVNHHLDATARETLVRRRLDSLADDLRKGLHDAPEGGAA